MTTFEPFLLRLLRDRDPMGVVHESNPRHQEEHAPEVGTITPRLPDARSVEDVRRIIYEEMAHWFGPEDAGQC